MPDLGQPATKAKGGILRISDTNHRLGIARVLQ